VTQPLILIIEDEAPLRRFLVPTLATQGYQVDVASTGAEGVVLAQERGNQTGVLVFMPVFRAGELQGFVLGVFRVGDLIDKSLAGLDLSLVHFQVRGGSGQLLAASPSPGERAGLRVASPFHCEVAVSVADQPWKVTFEPTLAFLDANRTPLPWLVQAVGLFLTGALGLFLLEMSIHKELLAQKEAQEAKA